MNPDKGRWIVLSNGDEARIKQFKKGALEQGCKTRINFLVPVGDLVSNDLMQPGWYWEYKPDVLDASLMLAEDEWIGILFDDQVPQSPQWDAGLAGSCHPWEIVTTVDGLRDGDWRKGAIVFSRDTFAAVGPIRTDEVGLKEDIARISACAVAASCWRPVQIQLPRHVDLDSYEPELPSELTVAALGNVMSRHGVRVINPDYTGVSLMISAPNISGKVNTEFMTSVMQTIRELTDKGVVVELSFEQFNADISLARSHIVAEFLQTNHTHLLMIDDDMLWSPSAVHRMFYAKKPIVAVAGPKKSYPLRFACSKVDSDGNLIPININPEDGTGTVNHVGAAFMLFERAALEEMTAIYTELAYIGSDGKKSTALFLPMVVDNAYLPEDFSFCQRWRALGKEIYVCPDVPLGHIGRHIYEGSLMHDQGRGPK